MKSTKNNSFKILLKNKNKLEEKDKLIFKKRDIAAKRVKLVCCQKSKKY